MLGGACCRAPVPPISVPSLKAGCGKVIDGIKTEMGGVDPTHQRLEDP